MTQQSIHAYLTRRGYSRREFMRLCGALAGVLGMRSVPLSAVGGLPAGDALSGSPVDTIARALQESPRVPLIWLETQDCAGCTMALTRSSGIVGLVLDTLAIVYHETLSAAAGFQLEEHKQAAMARYAGEYLLVVEGSVPTGEGGAYCTVGGRSAVDLLTEAAAGAKAVIATGNCAAYGGIPAADPNPTGAKAVSDVLAGRPVINVPGCPAVPEVTVGAIAHMVVFGEAPELDDLGRPLTFYGETIHERCERRGFFREGKFAQSFDDEGARQGWCLFELGCRGPMTFNACARLKWGEGLSFPVESGHPCLGCSEPGFWDDGHFYPWAPRPFEAFLPRAGKSTG